jgi:FkbM family methyltransferase
MISYAQNFEDVILQRALSKIVRGYYIDIGAQEPEVDSVSNHFYSSGWSGINVEPVPLFAEALRKARPRDIVLEKAITVMNGPIELFEIENTGLSTLLGNLNEKYISEGRISNTLIVETVTLDALFETITEEEVHWMKIDVEGSEEFTLRSWQKSEVRPWIVVVEATEPTTQNSSFNAWEGILLDKDYSYVYGDGLNRFYLHKNHSELKDFFAFPPNIFDDFELSGQGSQPFTRLLNRKVEELQNSKEDLHGQVDNLQDINQELKGQVDNLQNANQELNGQVDNLQNVNQELNGQVDNLQNVNQELNGQIDDLANTNQDLQTEIDNIQNANRGLLAEFENLQSSNQDLRGQVDAITKQYDIARRKMINMNGHVLHMKVVALKFRLLQATRKYPFLQNQLLLLNRYGLKIRILHALSRLKIKKLKVNSTYLIQDSRIGLSKPGSHNVYLLKIIKNKIRNNENSI